MLRSRRRFLAALGAGVGGLAGCANRGSDTPRPTDGPADVPSAPPSDPGDAPGGRPTATPRNPDPLSVDGAWPQYGADAGHTGVSPTAGVPDAGRAYWQLRRVRSGPAVLADGRLFHYAKLGAEPSEPVTMTRTREPDAGTAHPVYGEPYVLARDARDGRCQWSKPLDGPAAGWPAVADGRVLVGVNGQISAYGAASGAVDWQHDLGDRIVGDPTAAGDAVVVPVQGVVDGRDGEVLEEPRLRAYAVEDGRRRWTARPPKRANSVAIANDTVAVVSGGWDGTGVVEARSLADGGRRWETRVSGDFFEGPVVAAGTVYLSSSSGVLHAVSIDDGERLWERPFDRRPAGVAADDDAVYVGAGRALTALAAADGGERWAASLSGSVRTPAVGDGVVYVGASGENARLRALDAADGTERWASDPFPFQTVEGDTVMAGVETQPTVGDGAVYANAVDGLYAFGPAD
jgi:outer membrane protein assembly factor BamB